MNLRKSTASSGWRNSTPRRCTHAVFYLFLGLFTTLSLAVGYSSPTTNANGLQLVVGDGDSGPNNTISVPVTVLNFTGIATFQGTISFDDAALTYSSATSPLTNMFFGASGQGGVPNDAVTFLWYEPSLSTLTLTDGDTIAMLEFTVNSGATTGFSDIVLDGSITPLAYATDPNSGSQSTPTVDPGGVDIDADAPTVDVISIISDNANDTELATVGNEISLSFTTSETPDQTPVVDILEGGAASVSLSGSGVSYTATKDVAIGGDGTVTFSIQIQDEWGNSSTATATTDGSFVIVDTEVPTITCPNPITQDTDAGECYATVNFADAVGDDNLVSQGYGVTVTRTGGPASGSQFNVGATTITYTVTDAAGNTNFCNFNITVEDNEAPTVLTQDITVSLDANGDASITAAQIDNGSSDACGVASTSLDITSFGCGDLGTVTVSLTVTDVNGNSASNTAVVTVEDNIAPSIVCPAPQTIDTDAGICTAAAPDLTGLATVDDNCGSGSLGLNTNNIATGYHHTLFIEDDGSLWSTGYNSHGQLGLGFSSTSNPTATQIGTDTDWAYVDGGEYHSFALKTDGTLWAWGRGVYGNLGISGNQHLAPVQVGTDTDWVSVSCANYNTLALKSDGSLWAWGYNNYGQVGNGSTTNQHSPIQLGTATDWVAVQTGDATSMALKSDGTLWAWGYNGQGQLGIGSNTHQNTPVQVGSDTDWESISSGYTANYGIKSNGTLWAWGRNNFGQLGIGSTADQNSPAQVGTDSDWAEISGGSGYAKALKSNGTLWSWGRGSNGRLGNGTTSGNVTSPAQIGTDTDWAALSRSQGAGSHAFALKSNNNVYGWGRNNFGQMGNGTTADVSSPIALGLTTTPGGPGSSFVITQSPAPGTPLALGANTITLSTVDGSGNPASCTVVVTVEDNEAPTVVTQGITVQLDANGDASITAAQIDNGSSDACGIASTSLDITSFDCSNIAAPVTVTLTVTDVNGNSSTGTAVVTVQDNVAPTVLTQDITVQLDAAGAASIAAAQIDNGSSDACGIASSSLDISSFDCNDVGNPVTVTLTVTDIHGNSDSETAVVTVEDNVLPTVVTQDITVQLDANGAASITAAQIDNGSSDACGVASTSLDITSFGCADLGTVVVTLTVTDVNGNSNTGTATVTVEDNIAPTIVCPAPQTIDTDAGLCTAAAPDLTVLTTATDNCGGPGGGSGAIHINQIATGFQHSYFLKDDGTLWSTGRNHAGQLGNGSSGTSVSTATQIGTDTDWASVSAGEHQGFALKTDGSLWVWGRNAFGELGVPGTQQLNPVQIGTDTDWVSISCKTYNTLAVKSDGTLWAWGYNLYGSVGNGTNTNQHTPLQIGTDTDWASASTGSSLSLVLKSDGSLWAWGRNDFGQLGIGSTVNQNVPVQVGSATDWESISCGTYASYAIKSDGSLWSWGRNDFGELGIGSTIDQSSPVQVGTDTDWAQVSGGLDHVSARKTDGTLWSWGKGSNGRLGNGTISGNVSSPGQIGTDTDWDVLSEGEGSFSFAVKSNTNVYGWGRNHQGQLGIGTTIDASSPTALGMTITPGGSAGSGGSGGPLVITQSPAPGTPLALGANTITLSTVDGSGNAASCQVVVTVEDNEAPTVVTQDITVQLDANGDASITAAQIDNGSSDACGIASTSLDISTFDCNNVAAPVTVTLTVTDVNGNSSTGTAVVTVQDNVAPTVLTQDITVQLDAAGVASITAAQIDNGSSDACGIASSSLDISSFDCNDVGNPVTVTLTVTDVNGNSDSETAVVTVEDNVLPTVVTQDITVQLDANGAASITAAQIDNGSSDACGVASTSLDITSFGCADLGTVTVTLTVTDVNGNSNTGTATVTVEDNIAPTIVCPAPQTIDTDAGLCTAAAPDLTVLTTATDNCGGSGGNEASKIATGSEFSLLIKDDGSLWAVGRNHFGQLGIGSTADQHSPVQVGTDMDWASVEAGGDNSYALKTDGTLWAWGRNQAHALGIGNTIQQNSPVQVGTDTDWAMLSAFSAHVVALKNDGTLWAWGRNNDGQMGNGTTGAFQSSILQIGSDTDWISVAAGGTHAMAIKSNGTLWVWGSGTHGQLGLGATIQQTTPLQIGSDTDWMSLSANSQSSYGIKSNGTLWAWGRNTNGELGIGSTTSQSSPTQVGTDTDWTEVSGGLFHLIARKTDGTLWAAGEDNSGRLGIGSPAGNQTSPVQIGTDTDWIAIAKGQGVHNLAVKSADNLWAWGGNSFGQVGDGTSNNNVLAPIDLSITLASSGSGSGGSLVITQSPAPGTPLAVGANTITLSTVDGSGNTASCQVVVTVEDNELPTVVTQDITVQLDAAGAASITAAQIDNGSSDPCGIASTSLDITSFDCSNVGSPVTVTLTVTDVNGNSNSGTATVTVEDNVLPTVLTQDISVQLDAAGNASITPAQIDNGSSDNCAIDTRVLDISSFDCNDVALSPITVSLTVTDVNGNSAAQTALVTVLDDPIISVTGQATYPSVAAPVIPGVIWDLAGDDGPLTQTAPSVGNPGPYGFDFLLSPCGSTNDLGADKIDDAATNNGVDIADAFGIVQHILQINALTDPYKIIAADVNANQNINIFDAFQILQKLVGTRQYFTNPVTGIEDAIWTFIPSDYTFPNPAAPYGFPTRRDFISPTADAANQDFVGVKLGDVNQDWNPAALRTPAPADSFYFEMGQGLNSLTAGSRISIPVRVKDFNAITGYQLTMTWDAQVLRLTGITDGALQGVYNDDMAANGYLSAAWVDFGGQSVSLKNGDTAFELEFDVIGEAGMEARFEINSDATPVKAFDMTGERLGIGFSSSSMTIGGTTSIDRWELKGYSLLQNVPNPFSTSTHLIFSLGQREEVDLTIYDVRGQLIQRFDGKYPTGEHQIEWNGRNEKGMEVAQGIYIVRIQAGGFSSAIRIQKMN
ncbi:MAG: HYR domain-containing protein [Bacteroidota bacterium]